MSGSKLHGSRVKNRARLNGSKLAHVRATCCLCHLDIERTGRPEVTASFRDYCGTFLLRVVRHEFIFSPSPPRLAWLRIFSQRAPSQQPLQPGSGRHDCKVERSLWGKRCARVVSTFGSVSRLSPAYSYPTGTLPAGRADHLSRHGQRLLK
jgi:hypothetical protein